MRPRRILVLALACAALGAVAVSITLRPRLSAAERGRRLAERTGCFGCHGGEGLRGAANPGRLDRVVPNYRGDLMMYAKTADEVREWIRDGVPASRSRSQTWRDQRERGVLRMPAFGRRLAKSQIEDLVAFVRASAEEPEPEDSLVALGLERADALGCVGCHGAGGRLARPNPGSLKGYVPSWDGPDFAELVGDSTEFREWVEEGVSHRLRDNPAARFFLRRATLRMPAFRRHLTPGDVPALWSYIVWLRAGAGAN